MSDWKECILGELISVKHGWPFKSEYFSNIRLGRPIVVAIGNFKYGGGFRFSSTKINEYEGDYPSEYELKPGDILLIMTCQTEGGEILGIPGIIPDDGNLYLHNQRLGKVVPKNKNKIDLKFLYYLMLTKDINQELAASASGTKILHTSPSRIENLKFLCPSFPEQQAIANLLGSLDAKIGLLHCQSLTLENIAQTLFRQWFFVKINRQWKEKPLSEVANFLNGLACQKFPPQNALDRLPVLKIRELSSGITGDSDWVTSKVQPEYIIDAGDVIFSWSASLMVKIWDDGRCVLNQHLFKVTSSDYPKWFYYLWCKHHLAEFQAIAEAHATTMGHIKRGDLDEVMVLVPGENELKAMSVQMEPIVERIISTSKQIRTLEKLRNILLPKLISGEVRVRQ